MWEYSNSEFLQEVLINPNSVFSKTQRKQEIEFIWLPELFTNPEPSSFSQVFNSLNQHDDNPLCSYTDNWSRSFVLSYLIYNLELVGNGLVLAIIFFPHTA